MEENFLSRFKKIYPEKFVDLRKAFSKIHRGDRIFIGTACGEPVYLVRELVAYVESYPKAFVDAEVIHIWTLGVTPYTDEKFKRNFRHNSFFIGENTRKAVNEGNADYTPIFLSRAPDLLRRKIIRVDVALIQLSPPDKHGYMSYGISVDLVKTATENADLIIAQVNKNMPRTHGNSFIYIEDVDFIVPYDEPLLEYKPSAPDEISERIGKYVAKLVENGSTIQVGYGSIPDAVLSSLKGKKNLGVHTELLTDGIVNLMKEGVITNREKSIHRNKTVASFCLGTKETYDYLDDNPDFEFHPIEYTNNPLIIAQNKKMTAINTALQIDLTGQATAESIAHTFYSGIGGQADFMRGALLGRGRSILAIPSTARKGEVSRIVPFLEGGATLTRGDIQYVVTEYGIAYLEGKNIRERAMELISIAHPKFRAWLLEEAKKHNLVFKDQAIIPGARGEYPEELETWRRTKKGLEIFLRPVKISDEPLLKEFFYSLSDNTIYRRFMSARTDMPHERLQEFCIVDFKKEMVIIATIPKDEKEEVIGLAQYTIDESNYTAEIAMVVRDDYQNKGIGKELVGYLAEIAKKNGLLGFTAEVLVDNKAALHLLDKVFETEKKLENGVYKIIIRF
ncbi:MAG: GNAT family N-acetyltransferase [Thermoplasmatales archaeon]|nr:GNAT family N-acetyltransferase [Thermoplasmatales archaeon]